MEVVPGHTVSTQHVDVATGRFSAGPGKRVTLISPTALLAENRTAKLKSRIQKPGAAWLALVASVITFIIVIVVAQAIGFAAGPGYLIWYYIFSRNRRTEIELDLAASLEVVADDTRQRIAIRIPVEGTTAWIGLNPKGDYPRVRSLLSGIAGLSMRSGPVKKSAGTGVIVATVVVCFIGIAAAISIPNLTVAQRKAKEKATYHQLNTVLSGVFSYQTDKGVLPDKLEDLIPAGFLSGEQDLRDSWGRHLIYQKTGETFILKSLGKDGIESQDDLVAQH
jgi:competence protein ComGC